MTKIEIYKELLAVATKHLEVVKENIIQDLTTALNEAEMSALFNIELEHYGPSHYKVKGNYNEWFRILYSPNISWSDDGQQPENEWLYVMSFPCGAYTLSDSYPEQTFQDLFEELKGMGAKYCDTVNHSLYFPPERTKEVVENYKQIYKKYANMVQSEVKKKRKQELIKELTKLESNDE